MANFIGRLGVLLGLDSAEFRKGLEQASRQLDSFVEKAKTTSLVGATAFAAMAYQALKLADEISDTAKANDMAVDSVLKLRNALALSGGEAENAGKFLSSFTATIDKAAEGSFETQKTLKMLGVSLGDLRTMNIDQLFAKTVDNLAKMEDPLTRNAKAMELFGRAAKGVDFVALNEELKNGANVTDEQSIAIEKAAAAFDDIEKSMRDFSVMLASQLGPSIKTTIDYLNDMKNQGTGLGSVFKTVFQTIVVLGSNVAFVFEGIADEIRHTFENAKILATQGIDAAIAANEKYDAYRKSKRQNLDFFQAQIMGESVGRSANDPRRSDYQAASTPTRTVKPGVDKEAEAAAKKLADLRAKGFAVTLAEIDEYRKLMALQQDGYTKADIAQKERQKLASTEIDRAKEMLELAFQGRNMRGEDLQYAQELKEIEWKRLDAREKIMADETLNRTARENALQRENDLAEKANQLAQKRLELTRQTREGTLAEGFLNAMDTMGRNVATEFERGQQAFGIVLGNMEQAIDNFVKNGKLSFKDLARSIIQQMIAIQMKAAAMRFLGAAFSMFSPTGASANPSQYALDFSGAKLGTRASGGSVTNNTPYLVGERGPELFMPSRSGTIIPNNQVGNMGGVTNVTNNYINAIDTKSFEDRLLGSSNTIWAANQYANKSLASNGRRA